MGEASSDGPILVTPLNAAHRALGAKMVPFAGYDMPVQYPTGILTEHLWTRAHAGLFDVSHMGQAALVGPDFETVARAFEALVPTDVLGLSPGQQRYTQLLDDGAGILDDLMVSRPLDPAEAGRLSLVVNAANKEADYAWIAPRLPAGVRLERADDRALLALQGPEAPDVMVALGAAEAATMGFMRVKRMAVAGFAALVSRSGYTGEDGYEISVAAGDAEALWTALLADPRVKPIGLGARDSLRLEAGLCLHGHEISPATTPVEGAIEWSIPKRRRLEGGFPGAAIVERQLAEGPPRRRVGLRPEGRQPAREGTEVVIDGRVVGTVTSGGFGPSVAGPVAMGLVETAVARPGTKVELMVRGKPLPAEVVALPFVPNRFYRGPAA